MPPPPQSPFDPPPGGSNPNGMGPAPPGSPNGTAPAGANPFGPPPDELSWAEDGAPPHDPLGDGYAIESRAEILAVSTVGNRVRRGEVEHLDSGDMESFVDSLGGHERTTVTGLLREKVDRTARIVAGSVETTVHGRMSLSIPGWSGEFFSGEDSIMLGGTMTDMWHGPTLIMAAMSDDLVVGGGVRLTTPVDVWLAGLMGMEDRPGTAQADGVLVEACGTLFEREYATGNHVAGIVRFSGKVYQTQRVGFRPLMKTALGVRNLIPGAGGPASESTPPSPPSGGGGGEAGLLAVGVAGGAGSVGGGGGFADLSRLADTAPAIDDVASLRHSEDTAGTLEELSDGARFAAQNPNGMGAATDLPQASPPGTTAGAAADNVPWQSPASELAPLSRGQHVGALPDAAPPAGTARRLAVGPGLRSGPGTQPRGRLPSMGPPAGW